MPSLFISPTTLTDQLTTTLTLTGVDTLWTQTAPALLFSVNLGTLGTPVVTSDTAATVAITFGAVGPAAVTFTDNTTGVQVVLPVNVNPNPPAHELRATLDIQIKLTATFDADAL